uniref:EF-hand domain-containing protein n=1 Tax=Eutreptiella gymnastica TaxID=73025 RepID=A0A7S4GJB4_9EUGL|eukprot:CAMPEP_0174360042 /NCGR_PEP_ID=MMETSP0811_2-20130205/51869_1 /TAXON_ID=73025 ORGANISM="Eutreptiella gymnastica-like, Strain CCMP1594" /NCGR_SAMPLE_ID=MMETSP0811_2 /ASSEMBLY_ACC=CAM_ASM_000667 /LENGTH=158 /DNA_ID=CAMNT_0015495319 /DNA_START=41 /DNA_END=517 /DNA_ORIENTATION=-
MTEDSDAKVTQLREIFGFFEQNGVMDISNLPTAVRAMDLNPSEKQLKAWNEELKQSNDGLIDFTQFRTFMMSILDDSGDTKETIMNAFKVFDKAGCGFIETKELKTVMMSMGEKYSEKEFDELVRHHNSDGWIKYSDLADRLLLSYQQLGDELNPVIN